ncbi:MAG: trimethylamine methyltransferase family protein, partial [Ilumatobacteraceae bacterium]
MPETDEGGVIEQEVGRRRGRRAGGERSLLPGQRPFAQPRLRYRPTEVVSEDELEAIHVAALRVLSDIGMNFLDPESRDLLRDAGASIDGERVRFDPEMVVE